MEVEVYNMGMSAMLKKKHVGAASVQLTTLIPKANEPLKVVVNLLHNKKNQKGRLTMKCTVVDPDSQKPVSDPPAKQQADKPAEQQKPSEQKQPDSKPTATTESKPASTAPVAAQSKPPNNDPPPKSPRENKPEEKKQAAPPAAQSTAHKPLEITDKTGTLKLTLSSFEARELIDTGAAEDRQDPCLDVIIGKKTFTTERKKDAGTEAKFPETFEFTFPVSDYDNNKEVRIINLLGTID